MNEAIKKDQKDYITMLKERDKPMAMGRFLFTDISHSPIDICPNDGELLIDREWKFCPVCGQRMDRENYKFDADYDVGTIAQIRLNHD